MRDLHGVIAASLALPERKLKHHALLFDKFVVIDLNQFLSSEWRPDAKAFYADIEFLRSRKVVSNASTRQALRYASRYTFSLNEREYLRTNLPMTPEPETVQELFRRLSIYKTPRPHPRPAAMQGTADQGAHVGETNLRPAGAILVNPFLTVEQAAALVERIAARPIYRSSEPSRPAVCIIWPTVRA